MQPSLFISKSHYLTLIKVTDITFLMDLKELLYKLKTLPKHPLVTFQSPFRTSRSNNPL